MPCSGGGHEQIKGHFTLKGGKLVVRHPRIISSLLMSELNALTQGGIIS